MYAGRRKKLTWLLCTKINEVQGWSTQNKRTISAGGEISEVDIEKKRRRLGLTMRREMYG
jgi:hypothetical protein